ncbi:MULTISPECIES: pirin-like bicupin family protein [unclassified Mycolicibacterium]|uniref:pirin family protein n=1 Tax=unclassified Mycolicibacterium TaxID=2636767 RepID=UPI0012DEBF2C|nr:MULTISPECIES: pirin-like bicupin family protein [unclassified Mycolicibacterium]MUL82759.1 pirin family protein [Mycolicibacterium sp. CBMA 329]MUL89094.1 pirin family protein [Mycolicibacterium sp. CBMA 331]MUL97661.1 pirin family protein [Mycolicibacterium sp. CBMA 334]MUM28665.1 pirin family protein [Mycolicibacterium sp. CBMA 295]MUM38610.1 pirin family protein [Mycolicibacterium sp. CBMA 247]
MASTVDIRRAGDRGVSTTDWLQSRHSFSFADYYDPANTHHGLLLVNNDDIVAPGAGFDTHPHRDMEIVTWVLSGQLAHKDSMGNAGVIYPGLAQRMSAGTGVQHSEMNGSADEPVHFVQMWVLPDTAGVTPSYQQQELELTKTLTPIASGAVDAAVTLHNRNATLYGARLQPGDSVELPQARYVHLFVARGTVTLEGSGPLTDGDAARLADSGGQRVVADTEAEILVWEMNAGLGGA